jgi:phenylalanyl-tRNA synthetase beta chain
MDQAHVAPSPWWLEKRLLLSGSRPINNVVDVTNYVRIELGQPLHAFDADTLKGQRLVVRHAKNKESLLALDGRSYSLNPSMLVIADEKRPVALAGIMGGEETQVAEKTRRIAMECATFDPVSVRQTSRALHLSSSASMLFEKGLSSQATSSALARAVGLVAEIAGGVLMPPIVDISPRRSLQKKLSYNASRVNVLVGMNIPAGQQKNILKRLGFLVRGNKVTVPFWRERDVTGPVDLVEEIARVYGYHHLPSRLPAGTIPTAVADRLLLFERRARLILQAAGWTEVMHDAFTNEAEMALFSFSADDALHLENPLSLISTHFRTSLIPAMIRTIEENQHTTDSAGLFELSAVHTRVPGTLPDESPMLLLAMFHEDGARNFSIVKGAVERLCRELRVEGMRAEPFRDGTGRFHPARAVRLPFGILGEIAPDILHRARIDKRVTIAELNLTKLLSCANNQRRYTPVPEFPDVRRDLAFVVGERLLYETALQTIKRADQLIQQVELLNVYQGAPIPSGKKSFAFRLTLRAPDRTLSSEEAEGVMKKVSHLIEKEFHGIVR